MGYTNTILKWFRLSGSDDRLAEVNSIGGVYSTVYDSNGDEVDVSTVTKQDTIIENQTNGTQTTKITDINGVAQGVRMHEGILPTSSVYHLIAEGLIANHEPLFKIGYNLEVGVTEEDIWSAGGKYVFPTAEMGMEVVSTDNTQDIGVVIKGDATGDTVQSDADGTLTTLEDDDVDFTAATAVAVGDCVILDPHGTSPEYGIVTAVAAHTLTVSGGFSKGGSGASRYYAVVDESAHTGALVVLFEYLDIDYVTHYEIVVLNGTTAVDTINTDIYRINNFEVVCAGSAKHSIGALALRGTAGTPNYAYITTNYTISRQMIYTVPAGYTAYITHAIVTAATPNDTKVQSCRVFLRSNTNTQNQFATKLLYPKFEMVVSNNAQGEEFSIPLKFIEKSDVVASAIGFTGFYGPVTMVARGYLVLND